MDQEVIEVLATSDIDGCESQTSFTMSISSRIVPKFDTIAPVCETETITYLQHLIMEYWRVGIT